MPLEKLHHFLGYNNLALMMEQERKHYLLKVDKKKQYQDSVTGSVFNGTVDNFGSEVKIETNKTGIVTGSNQIKYENTSVEDIFTILSSSFTYNNSLNGLMYAGIKASKFAYPSSGGVQYKNYKVKFSDCQEVIIPFGSSLDNDEVYNTKWIKTSTTPILLLPDDNNTFSIEVQLSFKDDIENPVFYYPLTETLQPIGITSSGTTYTQDAITDDTFIGYPIYWFTCDNTNVGPVVTIEDNVSEVDNMQLLYVSNPGNVSKYHTQIFCNISGNNDATPTGDSTSSFVIRCSILSGSFTNTDSDKDVPINPSSIKYVNVSDSTEYPISFITNEHDKITLADIDNWTRSGVNAEVEMSVYDTNCESLELSSQLIPLFNYQLDENIPFNVDSKDIGYAGLHFYSSPYSNTGEDFPYDMNKWDGLPEWLYSNEDGVPQHGAIYAIHNTPSYVDGDPTTRQTAGLLLVPGKPKTTEDEEFTNDEIGRIYYLSNDDIEYHNNAIADIKKPERTLARICDIPTSLIQLTDISGLSPTMVVDTEYVHTDVSFKEADKDRLYNTLTSRWVKPSALDSSGHKISERSIQNGNDFIFLSPYLLDDVDFETFNDFRYYLNLNPTVDPDNVEVGLIDDRGTGYAVGDMGVCIVGGFAFNYTITSILGDDETGPVSTFEITPTSTNNINISNFNIIPDGDGTTLPYGTSPFAPSTGTGLRFSFKIKNYGELKTRRGGIFEDLFAIVKTPEGTFLYSYQITNPDREVFKHGHWVRIEQLADMEDSTINKTNGGLSVSDSYTSSIIPTMKHLPVACNQDNQPLTNVATFSTPSFVNIVDTLTTPVVPSTHSNDTKQRVDMTKFYCNNIFIGTATYHDWYHVLDALKVDNRLRYDSYLIWRWVDPSDNTNNRFEYGIINRSFNNLLSTDVITTLPRNALLYDNFVHSNENSSIVWNVESVGNMMWIYNPSCHIREKYFIDDATNNITIDRTKMTWNDIDFIGNTNINLIDDDGRMTFNICTNNPIQSPLDHTPNPIYEKSEFVQIVQQGELFSSLLDNQQPIGNWQLVFPRVPNYKLSNVTNNVTYDAIKMDVIRGSDLTTIGNVTDVNGNIVNKKILVIDQTYNGNKLKVWNSQTNSWDVL